MNPFDLRGPEFLVFYLCFAAAVLVLMHWLIRSGEPDDVASDWHLDDPYEIAYLRAGAAEALRVAAVALMDRGLLKATGEQVTALPDAARYVQRPIEREIVSYFSAAPRDGSAMFAALAGGPACEQYRAALAARGLLVGTEAQLRRAAITLAAIALLVGVAAVKIVVALGRGRTNIGFLVLLAFVFVVVAAVSAHATRTAAGNTLVGTLKSRFASLKSRAGQLRPGGASNELSYLVAAYGLGVLPDSDYPYVRKLFPKASASDSSSFTGGCGSSGCGGGGGGGGGGCGGCGGGGD
jgi:uncharacterized protein (TIGR04222 family)